MLRLSAVVLVVLYSSFVRDEANAAEPAETLRSIGGLVQPIAQSDPRLDVALHLADEDVTDDTLDTVVAFDAAQPDGGKVAWLNLAGTAITDAGCDRLAKLGSLERLHLERTTITDAGLAKLATLKNLQYLNLYGTKVTEAGLATIASLPAIEKVYVWQTGVSEDAIATFRSEHPEVNLVGAVTAKPVEAVEDKAEQKTHADSRCRVEGGGSSRR